MFVEKSKKSIEFMMQANALGTGFVERSENLKKLMSALLRMRTTNLASSKFESSWDRVGLWKIGRVC